MGEGSERVQTKEPTEKQLNPPPSPTLPWHGGRNKQQHKAQETDFEATFEGVRAEADREARRVKQQRGTDSGNIIRKKTASGVPSGHSHLELL